MKGIISVSWSQNYSKQHKKCKYVQVQQSNKKYPYSN
jgi:hypothetical protein